MPALSGGIYDELGEDVLVSIFNDANYEGEYWTSSNDIKNNGAVYEIFETALGQTLETIALAYDAEGRPGKMTVAKTSYPSSVDDLDQLSRPYPGSTFLSTPLSVKSKMDLLVKKPNTALLQLMRNN